MKKLQRYRPHWDGWAGCECELYLLGAAGMPADKKDSDVYSAPEVDALISALEAEYNQLREDLKQIREWLVPSTLNSFGNCRCHDEIEIILNREQEKQP